MQSTQFLPKLSQRSKLSLSEKNKKTTEIISNLIFLPIVESTLPKSYVPWWINLSLKQNLDRKKNNLMRLHSKDFSLLNKHLGWTYDWALTLSPVKNMCLVEYTKLGAYNPQLCTKKHTKIKPFYCSGFGISGSRNQLTNIVRYKSFD